MDSAAFQEIIALARGTAAELAATAVVPNP